ncbi:BrxA/BrxB family bacilliredoxin [Flavobacteriales bacterium]|nr:BrxA/BrxB family bacilliredoxin [Flavobacteriales bacterium]
MYPAEVVSPFIEELTSKGFKELTSLDEVDKHLNSPSGTKFVVINSVCGCAARNARPAAKMAVENDIKPDEILTVFAGFHSEATNQVRKYCLPYPPSSPSMALFKDGKLVHFIERHHIEGRPAEMIAENLIEAFKEFC